MTAPPLVQPGSFLTLHYRLSGPQGDIINTFEGPAATLTLGNTELSEAIEARLIGLAEGDHVTLALAPGEAFGPRNPDMLQWVPGRCSTSLAMQMPVMRWVKWWNFLAPKAKAVMLARCNRWQTTRCCLTSTTHWPDKRSAWKSKS